MCIALERPAYWDWINSEICCRLGTKNEQNKEKPSMLTDTEKTIAIIGAGPAGLAAAETFEKIRTSCTHIRGTFDTWRDRLGTEFLIIIYQRMYCFMKLIG